MAENTNLQQVVQTSTPLSNMIIQGTEAKYFIDIQQEGFSMEEDDFTVELRWGMRPKSMVITKQDMITDTSGKYFFEFSTKDMVGKVTAICKYYVPDVDDPDGVREEVDEQVIAFIATTPCPRFLACPKTCGEHKVTYERTDDSGIASKYQRLCTALGQPIVSADDLYFYVLTSYIEGTSENDNENENQNT